MSTTETQEDLLDMVAVIATALKRAGLEANLDQLIGLVRVQQRVLSTMAQIRQQIQTDTQPGVIFAARLSEFEAGDSE